MRRPFVAGNWKMNLLLADGRRLAEATAAGIGAELAGKVDVAICPPTLYVQPLAAALQGKPVSVGVQDVFFETSGAFTGEISAEMAADAGARYAVIGHSERRHTIGHHEDDRMINLKVRAAQRAGLVPILCVGETLAEREAEQTLDVLDFQLAAGLLGVDCTDPSALVVAYEPVWAIGTGRTATPDQAQEAHRHIRGRLGRQFGEAAAGGVRILYGGSVKPDNAEELFGQSDVDGGLIGGASLKAESFLAIVRAGLVAAG